MMAFRAAIALTGFALARGLPEGQAFVEELAQEVKDYKYEKPLPVPYEIQLDRDVGDLTLLPILEPLQAKVKQGTLETGREMTGFNAMVMIGRVTTTEKEDPTHPPPSYRMGGVGADQKIHLNGAVNPTRELTLQGWQRNKWEALKEELGHWNQRNPSKLVILHSSGDTLYGGCTENELIAKYDAVVSAAGNVSKIVMAGEVSPFPYSLGWKYSLPKGSFAGPRRTSMLSSSGFPEGWESPYVNCSDPKSGPCGPSGQQKIQFGNSGFMMGPVGDILDMLDSGDLVHYTASENNYINEYMLDNPGRVTIDYAGELVTSLHNLNKNGGPVELDRTNGTILKHKVSGNQVCFLYGSGNGFGIVRELAEDILGAGTRRESYHSADAPSADAPAPLDDYESTSL